MKISSNIGIDEKGYILNCIHKDNITEPWLSLVNESIREIKKNLKEICIAFIFMGVSVGVILN